MYTDIKLIIAKQLNKVSARDLLTTLPDDVFIVSYPKSGNTWTRFLIGNLVSKIDKEVDFFNIEKIVPDIYQNSDRDLLKLISPRYLKSHACFNHRYKKVIYIVRDPRDVAISMYFFYIKMNVIQPNVSMEDFINGFIKGDSCAYGSWYENVGSWLGGKKENILLLRYEDLLSNGRKELIKIAEFLNIDYSDKLIGKALSSSDFENMRKLEKKQGESWKPLKNSKQDMYFMRSGKGKQWESSDYLKTNKNIWSEWSELMEKLGYDL
jgi:hypothetical protein